MKKSWKKVFGLAMALCILATVTIGCGKKDVKPTAQAQAAMGNENLIGNMYKEGYPIVKEKETYHMISSFDTRQKKFNDMDFFKNLEEQSNIHIDWDLIETQDYSQKKNLIFASGEYPDAFFMGISDQDLNIYAPQGVLVAMDEYIDNYAPQIKKSFKEHPDYKQMCTYLDGKIYSLGSANEDPCQYNPDVLYVYKPWLDKLGLGIPKTTDEFTAMLQAFKDKDPNGNGKNDEIPLSAQFSGGAIRSFHSLSGAFGPVVYNAPGDAASYVYEDKGKIKFSANTQNFKEYVKYFNNLFTKGLIDQETFTQDGKQYFAKGKTQEITLGSFFLWNSENMVGKERSKDYVPIAPLKGPNGDQNWTNYTRNNGAISGSCFSITSKCKNPEVLVRWVDQFYDKKTSVESTWGPIIKGDNGMYIFKELTGDETFDARRYQESPVWPPACVYASDYNSFVQMPPMMVNKFKIKKEVYEPFLTTNTFPLVAFTQEETNWNTSTGNDIITFVTDNLAKWMMRGGIDDEWDQYLKKLESLNVKKHLEILQGAYDRVKAK